MNQVALIGNLCDDPQIRYSTGNNQQCVANFRIAINEGYGDKKQTQYINIVAFGKTAENCEKFLQKGSKVAVNGRIKTGSYDHKNGYKVYTFDVVAYNVEFLSYREGGNSTGQYNQQVNQQSQQYDDIPPGFEAVKDDCPF